MVVDDKGELWFCAKDVEMALGYDQPRKAVDRYVEKDNGTKHTLTGKEDKTTEIIYYTCANLYSDDHGYSE